MTIYALFTESNKSLMKDNYQKSFDVEFSEKGLKKMLDAIKIKDTVVVFIADKRLYSKVRFSSDFKDYKIAKAPVLDENSRSKDYDWLENKDDYVLCDVKQDWHNKVGKQIIVCIDRDKQIQLVEEMDLICCQATDINELCDNLVNRGEISDNLCTKMFLTDEQIAEMEKEDVI